MERRTSTNSESSIEPVDVSTSNKTLSSDANSSLALKTSQESDNVESDDNEDYLNNNTCKSSRNDDNEMRDEHEKSTETSKSKEAIRRDNLTQLMDKLKQKKFMTSSKNNNHSSEENLNSASLDNDHESSKQTSTDETKYICPICETVSLTQHDFTNHIRNHNNNRDSSDDGTSFTCRICSKVLSSASSLDRHVLVHTGERPFNCKYCNLTFTTNGNMHRHMRTHKQHQQHESYESDASTDSSGSAGTHATRNFPHNKRKSTDDDLTNRRKIRAVNHNNNNIMSNMANPLQKFCCPVCIRNDFSSMINLENHMDKEHPTIPAQCRHCEMVFKSHKALNAHRCASNKGINVQQGFKDLTFVDFSSEKFPIIAKNLCEQSIRTPITNQKFECPICYRAFPCSNSVEIHMNECKNEHHKAQDFSAKRRRSNSESSDDVKREDFFANLALHNNSSSSIHNNNNSTPSTPSSNAAEKSSSFTSPLSMIKTELGATPPFYQYFSEGRDFADIESIIRATSSGGLEKAMSDRENLYRDDEEPQDAFTAEFRKMKLRGEFPCRLCTMVFPNLRALKGHNRIHLSASGPGPYRCNMCPYSINDKAALIRHMRSHNGDRPYECALCNYAFTTKANCERHLRNRHGRTTRDDVKRAIIYHPSEDSSVDDHSKKIAMFNANNSRYQSSGGGGSDRSTPVSHLKDILQDDSPSSHRIQVKSLEKLKQRDFENDIEEEENDSHHHHHRPVNMSMSMDALDLSKKTDGNTFMSNNDNNNGDDASDEDEEDDDIDHRDELEHPKIPKFDLGMFEKNLLIQQQLLSETLPKLDPAQMFALFNRTFGFPTPGFPIHPALLLQNPLLMNPEAMKNLLPQTPTTAQQTSSSSANNVGQSKSSKNPSMSGGSLIVNPFVSPDSSPNGPPNQLNRSLDESPIRNSMPLPPFPPTPQESPKKISPTQPPQITNSGPVKMVIKNGVLMPKQKQRRYRTERPFACEHCSARFTLRSNMERHIKQQHPQFWAQRQRGNHGLLRRGPQPQMPPTMNGSPMMPTLQASGFGGISDQVKYAILAQQLKARESPKNSYPMTMPVQTQLTLADDEDEDEDDEDDEKPMINHRHKEDDDDDDQLVIDEDFHGEDLSKSSNDGGLHEKNAIARKIAENILEEAKKMGTPRSRESDSNGGDKDHEKKESKEEGNDLVSVSKLVDNATNSMMFSNYFSNRPEQQMTDHSDEEGLVASGSASESNNSGTDDPNPTNGQKEKKKSAYSLAPNRVSCPYCQRKFPWSSSLRRHILTHTGQKPFKCSQCPLLFTTKSNCDRHLLRKHGNVESAVSLQLPIDEMPEPVKEPVRISGRKISSEEPKISTPTFQLSSALQMPSIKSADTSSTPSVASDLPFKCHLCDGSFSDRVGCLEHIKTSHAQDFAILMAKVQLETEEGVQGSPDDDDHADKKGKYPDYANRKVICAFCLRRFWSTEDLRRHMRTHSGERPFNCDVCFRKFTLKHSMLRHRKKHSNALNNLTHFHNMKTENGENNGNGSSINNSASDLSDEESTTTSLAMNNKKLLEMMSQESSSKSDQELVNRMVNNPINKELFLKFQEKFLSMQQQVNSELLGNLLGINDHNVLNRMFNSSADEAAKMLGVEK